MFCSQFDIYLVVKQKALSFGPKLPYLGIFGLQLKKLAIFEINTPEFAKLLSFIQNKKSLNLELKMPFLVILGCNLKKLFSYLKLRLSNPSKYKVSCKKIYIFFEIKIALFGCFWVAILKYCYI